MTHWQATPGTEYFVPIQKTMDVLNDLKAQGKIKAIGAANVDINHIQEYIKYGDLDIIQCKYSILDRGIEDEIIPCAREMASRSSAILHLKWDYYLEHSQETTNQ